MSSLFTYSTISRFSFFLNYELIIAIGNHVIKINRKGLEGSKSDQETGVILSDLSIFEILELKKNENLYKII